MRLHQLSLTAFGPFAGRETVDFDGLAEAGLFLLTGPTGAGKTSILDAVCFALYGQVPGARGAGGSTRSLRSDHADAGVAPEVCLELTLRGRRLRIIRSPQWERAKKRGSGTTTEQARVVLAERTGSDWVTRSTRIDEAAQLIGALIGLTLPQFCSVVLLPQGKFAEFLQADVDRRTDLLETLFDTSRFASVERWLVTRRQETARRLGAVDDSVRDVGARLAQAAGIDAVPDLTDIDATGWLTALVDGPTGARAVRSHLRHAAGVLHEQHDAAADTLESATLVVEAHARRAKLHSRLADLEAAGPAREAAASILEAARAALPVLPLLAEVDRIAAELGSVHAAVLSRGALLVSADAEPPHGIDLDWAAVLAPLHELAATGTDAADAPARPVLARAAAQHHAGAAAGPPALPRPSDLTAVARRGRDEVGRLHALSRDEHEAVNLTARVGSLEEAMVDLQRRSLDLADRLGGSPGRRTELDEQCRRSRDAAATLPGARAAAALAADRAAHAARRDTMVAGREVAADRMRGRTDAAQLARARWLDLRQRRLDGMSAELALGLAPGIDCPVCGSVDHPRPARSDRPGVTLADERRADERVRAADEARALAATALAEVDVGLAAARAGAGGDAAAEELTTAATAAARVADDLAAAAESAPDDATQLSAHGEQHEIWVREQVSLDAAHHQHTLDLASARTDLAALRARLDLARGPDVTVAARAARLARLSDELDELAAAVSSVARLEEERGSALARVETQAAATGLGSVEAVLAAVLHPTELAALDAEQRSHDSELTSVRQQLAEPVLSALGASPQPDLHGLRAWLKEVESERLEAVRLLAAAETMVADLIRLSDQVRTLLADRAPLAHAHGAVDELARLAEGKGADNAHRMSLSGYVLAARLEQVAVSASQRLAAMSSGRYQLLHSVRGAGKGRGGLHLTVLDAWTGAERDPSSLSGGESFTASLALALGLADVVSAEAGGALLETLFVDEGFGSLDDDTLDEVMTVLDGLREGGRSVGIVSHVADLRQRVPVQLCVEKARSGSHVRQ